ncbi:MAG: hypothetical protein P8Y37_12640, partial [Anaerolineales bacterium]
MATIYSQQVASVNSKGVIRGRHNGTARVQAAAERIADKRVLKLIRRYLQAGILDDVEVGHD